MKTDGIRINKKMLLIDGHQGNSNMTMSNTTGIDVSSQTVLSKQMSDQYLLRVTGDDILTYEQQNLEITGDMVLNVTVIRIGTVTDIDGNAIPNVTDNTEWTNLTQALTVRMIIMKTVQTSMATCITGM